MSCFDSGVLQWFGLPRLRLSPSMDGSPRLP
jgi:hypothetical protein